MCLPASPQPRLPVRSWTGERAESLPPTRPSLPSSPAGLLMSSLRAHCAEPSPAHRERCSSRCAHFSAPSPASSCAPPVPDHPALVTLLPLQVSPPGASALRGLAGASLSRSGVGRFSPPGLGFPVGFWRQVGKWVAFGGNAPPQVVSALASCFVDLASTTHVLVCLEPYAHLSLSPPPSLDHKPHKDGSRISTVFMVIPFLCRPMQRIIYWLSEKGTKLITFMLMVPCFHSSKLSCFEFRRLNERWHSQPWF